MATKTYTSRPEPITADDLERYAWDLVERGLASKAVLGTNPRRPRKDNHELTKGRTRR